MLEPSRRTRIYGTGSTVVLTTAHLNHTPEDCRPENLRAMCQGCHLHYDREHHAQTRRRTREFTLDFPDSHKILPLSDAAFRAIVSMILHSLRDKTNGRIRPEEWSADVLVELREAELLDGDVIVDFEDFPRGGTEGRPSIPLAVRRQVMERDGFRCVFCGSIDALSLDHIVRFRDGGPDTVENLRVLCIPCNQERG
jgi:5-methylcytosine-specific restriction endonuclease McrA